MIVSPLRHCGRHEIKKASNAYVSSLGLTDICFTSWFRFQADRATEPPSHPACVAGGNEGNLESLREALTDAFSYDVY